MSSITTVYSFIIQELANKKCPIDEDAAMYLAEFWHKKYGATEFEPFAEYLEILADYDYGATENGQMDRKTVESFVEDELC